MSSFAGCLSSDDTSENPQGTEGLPIRFWLEEVSLSSSEQEPIDPIVFEELTPDEQEIVQTAVDEKDYTVAPGTESPEIEILRDRIELRTGNGETLVAYLKRGDIYYRVGFADGDHIIADPDQ